MRRVRIAAAVLVCTSCSGSPEPPPAGPTTPAPPTAAPSPLPARTAGCGVGGPGPGNGVDCPRELPTYLEEVGQAIDRVVARHPEYFDFSDTSGNEEYYVVRPARFTLEVIRELETMGLCAAMDTKELQVKSTNDFNDQFHIILSSGHIRRGYPSYRATCTPAAFPTPALPIGPPPGCALPPSRELTCSRTGESPSFLPAVEAAIDALRAQRPELFSGGRVLDPDAYHEGVARLLTTGGRCARFDGQEIVMKTSNESSDQYRILLSSGEIRRGEGAWRSTCYPAAF